MNCRKIQKMLAAYQDGELGERERSLVATHLQGCRQCSTYYAEMEDVWQAMDGMQEIEPSPDFYQAVCKKINAPSKSHVQKFLSWVMDLFPAPAVTIPVVLIGILCGVALGNIIGRGLGPKENRAAYTQSLLDSNTVGAFSSIPPGTLGDGYLRLAANKEEHKR